MSGSVAAWMEGDQQATAALVRAGELIGRAMANVVNLLSPEAVALGGTVARGTPVLLAEVKKTVELYVQPYLRKGLAIVEVETGADAPILGAAHMALGSIGAAGRTTSAHSPRRPPLKHILRGGMPAERAWVVGLHG